MKIANKNARGFVKEGLSFHGSNIFAESEFGGKLYVVYSYGAHFPMFARIEQKWIENTDRYSRSTSRHQNQCRPEGYFEFIQLNTAQLKELIERTRAHYRVNS